MHAIESESMKNLSSFVACNFLFLYSDPAIFDFCLHPVSPLGPTHQRYTTPNDDPNENLKIYPFLLKK